MTPAREQVIQMAGESGLLDMMDDEYVRSAVWVAAAERFVADIAQAARAQALEDAKAACLSRITGREGSEDIDDEARDCAADIEALKGKP